MKKTTCILVLAALLGACNVQKQNKTTSTERSLSAPLSANSSWTPIYGGVDKSYDTQLLQLREQIAPTFQQFTFTDAETGRTIDYNLFIPKDYNPQKQYPLVMFIADASTVGKGVIAPLMQGYGGIIWATPESQAAQPCLVLVPSFKGPEAATNDQYQVTDEVPTTYHLLQHIIKEYNVDNQRIYATGQSMGGMIAFYLNAHYPNLFAASLYVSTHWNFEELKPVIGKQKFFYIASQNDKAATLMQKMEDYCKENEIPYAETLFAANLPDADKEKAIKQLIAKDENINIVRFTAGSMLPAGYQNNKGGDHMYAFDYAYQLKAVCDWLLSQHK